MLAANRTDLLSFHITALVGMSRFIVIFTFLLHTLSSVGGHVGVGHVLSAMM